MKNKNYIITFHRAHNYGAFLQVYALQSFLKSKEFETYVVDYRNNNIERGYKILNLKTKNPIEMAKRTGKALKYYSKLKVRKNTFDILIRSKLSLTNKVKTIKDMEKLVLKNDNIIVGSDQVWNINITRGFDKVYYLMGDFKCNKISYAASIGDNKLILKNEKSYQANLSNFDAISAELYTNWQKEYLENFKD